MTFFGTFLVVFGLLIWSWLAKHCQRPLYEQPPILMYPLMPPLLTVLWITTLLTGLFIIWQNYPSLVAILVGCYLLLIVYTAIINTDRAKIKQLFKIYDRVRLYRLDANEKAIFQEMAQRYFQQRRWDEFKINIVLETIFRPSEQESLTLTSVIALILDQKEHFDQSDFQFRKVMARIEKNRKRQALISKLVAKHQSKMKPCGTRPTLSLATRHRLEVMGFNVDELSNEQLQALEGLENPAKYGWLARTAQSIGAGFALWAIYSLLMLQILTAIVLGIIGLGLMWLAWRSQTERVAKQFQEASIRHYAETHRRQTEPQK